ncbi:hypothetical protein ALP71_03562 [Pseudomonas coronafaciens pv. garcae]|nr:hypothetical protein ALP71_03562 [Pseudomonas coronafaciens pv. garcae]
MNPVGQLFVGAVGAQCFGPVNSRGDTPTRNPMAMVFGTQGHLGANLQSLGQGGAIDPGGHHSRDRRCAGDAQSGVMGDLTGLHHLFDKSLAIAYVGRDAHRGNTHCCAIGGAEAASLFRAVTIKDHFNRALGRRPQQVLGALGFHGGFPLDQAVGQG